MKIFHQEFNGKRWLRLWQKRWVNKHHCETTLYFMHWQICHQKDVLYSLDFSYLFLRQNFTTCHSGHCQLVYISLITKPQIGAHYLHPSVEQAMSQSGNKLKYAPSNPRLLELGENLWGLQVHTILKINVIKLCPQITTNATIVDIVVFTTYALLNTT